MASSYEGSSSLGGGGESGMFTLDMEEGVEGGWSWPWRSRQCAGEIMGLIRVQIREREREREWEEEEKEKRKTLVNSSYNCCSRPPIEWTVPRD